MQALVDLIKEYWVLVVLALLVLFVVRFFFRTIFKLAILAVVVGIVLVFVFHWDPTRVLNLEKQAATTVGETLVNAAKPILESELSDATYSFHPDGTYEVKTKDVRIDGKKGDPTATLYFGNQKAQINLSELGQAVEKQIETHQASLNK